jgi:hypothetical protein
MSTIINATTTNGVVIQPDNSGSLVLQTNNGTTAVTIDTSQNVGIGTASPAQKLQVSDGGDAGDVRIQLGNTRQLQLIRNSTFENWIRSTSTGADFYIDQNANANLIMRTNATERMRINSGGDVLIGTTSAANPPSQGIANFGNQTNSQIGIGHANGTASGQYYVVFGYNGGTIGGVTQNGTTAVAYNTSSDYRLKDNIALMTGALDKVAQLKPVTYTWKADGSDGQGFIAHELAEVVPDCVTGEKDAVDEDGNIKPQGIDTSFLVATLTAAIQEMKAIIDAQSVTINDLKARVETLEAK